MAPIGVVSSSGELGGAELSLLPVVRQLANHRPVVAYLPAAGPLEAALLEAGAEIRPGFALSEALTRASRHYGISNLPRVVVDAAAQQVRLVRALRHEAVGVVYCNGFRAQLGATVPSAAARIPVVWHVRDFVPPGYLGSVWSTFSRGATLVVANSAATATQPTLRTVKRPPVVIPNGIDLKLFRQRDAEPSGSPLIGMAGHLTAWKGHSRFLRVLRAVREAVPDARGAIAGGAIYDTADQRRNLEHVTSEITRLGLGDACAIEAVTPAEMAAWLAKLTVLVHCPDRPEPFGRSLVEAMAVGVPIVAAAGEGAAEVVGEAAVVRPLTDQKAVVEGVLQLLGDPKRRAALAAAGQARARERYDVRIYATRVAEAVLGVAERADAGASRS
jgi:glycosyltransferase involved in cell wall biosynthesis